MGLVAAPAAARPVAAIAILKADRREKALSALEGLPHGAVSFWVGSFSLLIG